MLLDMQLTGNASDSGKLRKKWMKIEGTICVDEK